MDIQKFTRDDLRAILRASDGIRSQVSLVERKSDGRLSPARTGHAIAWHVHSATLTEKPKTKFRSLDEMVEALWLVCQSRAAAAHVQNLIAGERRAPLLVHVNEIFGFECQMQVRPESPTKRVVSFSSHERREAGHVTTACLAIFEGRERAGTVHLQVHTFYPKFEDIELNALLQSVRDRSR
jgi:hypothetical protein